MILHTVNKPSALTKCEHLLTEQDTLLLIEDGVLLAPQLSVPCFALESDLSARGIQAGDLVTIIDYDRFVALSCDAEQVCAWF